MEAAQPEGRLTVIRELPSGLTIELRKMRGQELIDLANTSRGNKSQTLSQMVAPCWVRTVESGPYASAESDKPLDWKRVLRGDVIAALLAIRVASVPKGEAYAFQVKCEGCGEQYTWNIDDLGKLPVQKLSAESQNTVLAGALFEMRTSTGRDLTFKLATEEDDEPVREIMKALGLKKVTLVETLAAQIQTIDGVTGNGSPIVRHRLLAGLEYDELLEMRDHMDSVDCGINSQIETTCDSCDWKQEVDLPLDKTFFRPARKK